MASNDITVADFVLDEASTNNMAYGDRDLRPVQGSPCLVEGCKTPHFHNRTMYMMHWRQYHVGRVNKFTCPVDGYHLLFEYRWRVKQYVIRQHKLLNPELMMSKCTKVEVKNNKFIDPCNERSLRFAKLNVEAREKVVQERNKYATENKVEFTNIRNQGEKVVCRGHYLGINFKTGESTVVKRW